MKLIEWKPDPNMWGDRDGKDMLPGLWVQLSPEIAAEAAKAWREHMAKPPEQRIREYYEGALRGLKMIREAIEHFYGDPAVEEANKIIQQP